MAIIVIDNFLNNPLETRAYALTLPFTTYGNYPGKRTMGYAQESWIPYLEKYLPSSEKITWFDTHPLSYNGSFQLCGANDGNSWIHRDMTDWAAILFLTPDAPIESGLTLYRHKRTKALGSKSPGGTDAEKETADPAAWEPDCVVGNVFNRLVMFRCDKFHKASVYFGDSAEHARLFQVHFFNTTSPPLARWNLTMPRVFVVVMSTNRYEYLEKMLKSLRRNVSFEGCNVVDFVVLDDYPLKRDREIMDRLRAEYGPFRVIEHETNLGLPTTWKHAWKLVKDTKHCEWVFHLEDDIEFVETINVKNLIETYIDAGKPLSQLALARQDCYDPSTDIFARIRNGVHGTELRGCVTQTNYFTTMASIYPREIADRFPSTMTPQEHTVANFFAPKLVGAVYGLREHPPKIHHLGEISRGNKGPGFEHLPVDTEYHYRTGKPLEN